MSQYRKRLLTQKNTMRFAMRILLNFYRKTLSRKGQKRQADDIARFQKKSENNFILTFIAAAIISRENIPQNIINIKGADLELIKWG